MYTHTCISTCVGWLPSCLAVCLVEHPNISHGQPRVMWLRSCSRWRACTGWRYFARKASPPKSGTFLGQSWWFPLIFRCMCQVINFHQQKQVPAVRFRWKTTQNATSPPFTTERFSPCLRNVTLQIRGLVFAKIKGASPRCLGLKKTVVAPSLKLTVSTWRDGIPKGK